MKNEISVIIPIYILNQDDIFSYFNDLILSLEKNFIENDNYTIKEVIVINDNPSTPDSNKLKSILHNISNIFNLKYIRNTESRGQAHSRNIGAKHANGDYLHFIDQDDMIGDNFYRFFFLEDVQYDIMMTDCKSLNDKTTSFYKIHTKFFFNRAKKVQQLKFFFFNNIANSPGQFIIKKDFFEKINGFPELQFRGSDDFAFFLNVIKVSNSFKFFNKSRFFYRIHSSQSSKTLDMKASVLNAFVGHSYSKNDVMYWVKKIKLSSNYFVSILRIFLYRMFFNSFR